MDECDKEIKRWIYLEQEIPRKMTEDTGNQKQFSIGGADDRSGSGGSRLGETGD